LITVYYKYLGNRKYSVNDDDPVMAIIKRGKLREKGLLRDSSESPSDYDSDDDKEFVNPDNFTLIPKRKVPKKIRTPHTTIALVSHLRCHI
jgi:hypothetical protein